MIIGWIILSIVVGIAGSAREIGGLRSFAVSVLFSPLIGFIVVVFSKRKDLIEFENTINNGEIDEEYVQKLILERNAARKEKNWARADEIRDILSENNIELVDSKAGTTWRIK